MPEILNRTKHSRVYHKGSRYLVSKVMQGHLCRMVVDEPTAMTLAMTPKDSLDMLAEDLILAGKKEGSENYYEVKM